jgi:hypothetical protein
MIYQIKDKKIMSKLLEYFFLNKDNIIGQDNDAMNIEISENCCHVKDDINFSIGYGRYLFKFFNEIIKVNYFEEGKPKESRGDLKYFKRMTIEADNQDVLLQIIKDSQKIKDETTAIFISDDYGEWLNYNKIPARDLKTIYINPKIKNKIVSDMEHFLNSENDYHRFGIPYKLTFLLSGIPGSGKSSLIKAICNKFNFNLFMLSFSKKFDNDSLINAMKHIQPKSILLIEDIDCLFNKRDSTNDNQMTFSNLLNVLDGVLYKEGSIIFLTTNHPEKLDHALLRMGRVDNIFELDYPGKNEIKQLFCDLITCEDLNSEDHFVTFYDYIKSRKIPMAAIVNFLFKYNMNWEKHIDELLENNNFISKILGTDKHNLLFS